MKIEEKKDKLTAIKRSKKKGIDNHRAKLKNLEEILGLDFPLGKALSTLKVSNELEVLVK